MINVFISSTFDSRMIFQRDLIRHEINFRLNEMFNSIGKNVCIVDLSLGIPEGYPPLKVVEYCIEKVRSSDYFIYMMSDFLGTKLNEYLQCDYSSSPYSEFIKLCCDAGLHICDLEFLLAAYCKKTMLILRREGVNISPQINVYQSLGVQIDEKSIRSYSNRNQFVDVVIEVLSDAVDSLTKSLNSKEGYNKNSAQLSLLAKKQRYYIPVDENIERLNDYISSNTSKTLVIYGECGKTSFLTDYWARICNQGKYTVNSYFVNAESALINDMVDKLLGYTPLAQGMRYIPKMTDEYTSLNNLYFILKMQYGKNPSLSFLDILFSKKKSILFIDGIDELQTFEEIDLNPYFFPIRDSSKVIISVKNKELFSNNPNCIFYEVRLPKGIDIVREYFRNEQKELLLPYLEHVIESHTDYFETLTPYELTMFAQIVVYESTYKDFESKCISIIKSGKTLSNIYLDLLINRYGEKSVFLFFKYFTICRHGLTLEIMKSYTGDYYQNILNIFYFIYYELNYVDKKYFFVNDALIQAFKSHYKITQSDLPHFRLEYYEILKKREEREDILLDEEASLLYDNGDSNEMLNLLKDGFIAGFLFENAKQKFVRCYFNLIEDKLALLQFWRDRKNWRERNIVGKACIASIIQTIINDSTLTYDKNPYAEMLAEMLENGECSRLEDGSFFSKESPADWIK